MSHHPPTSDRNGNGSCRRWDTYKAAAAEADDYTRSRPCLRRRDARYGHIVARRIAGEEEEGLGRDGKLNGAFVMGVDSALDVFEREGKQVAHF